jgi:hypothetical protein
MKYFYNNMMRKYVISFAHLFSDVHVERYDVDGTTLLSNSKVPIVYATKNKMFYEIKQLPDTGGAIVSTYLPRMGFYVSGLNYDSARKFNNTIEINLGEDGVLSYPGVPYNITFDLSIITKTQDDLFQIIEQISSMFTPDTTITIKEIGSVIHRDVSLNLDSVTFTSNFDYDDLLNRTLGADLSFTLKGYIYPRIKDNDGKIIQSIINNYKVTNLPFDEVDYSAIVNQYQESIETDIIKTIIGTA